MAHTFENDNVVEAYLSAKEYASLALETENAAYVYAEGSDAKRMYEQLSDYFGAKSDEQLKIAEARAELGFVQLMREKKAAEMRRKRHIAP